MQTRRCRKSLGRLHGTAWALAGSNNGSSFTTVDTRSQASVAAGQSIFYELASPAFFRYWRWTITRTASGTDAHVANLALFGDEPSIWSSSAILAGIGQLSGLGTQSHPATAFPAGARLSGASALYALGGIPYSISARFGGVGTVLTRGGIQSRISAQLAGVSDLRSRYTIDLHPVVVHDNPVPPDSEFYDPARTPEQNAARNMMLTSGLNDSHRIDLPSGVVIGRSDPGFGPANGFIVEAPLVLTSDGLAIDIAALKILLGLP